MKLSIVPKPSKITWQPGVFSLSGAVSIAGLEKGSLFDRLLGILRRYTGLAVGDAADQAIRFIRMEGLPPEGYSLDIGDREIAVRASGGAGFFYALSTLEQLLAANGNLDGVRIEDAPRFAHRGLLLDCSRHFIPKQEVLRVLDLAALFKLNRLHWHLTDDQGWRVEIEKYPLLTEMGSKRAYSVMEKKGIKPEYPRDGFYTRQDVREIVAYAKDLHIEVLPEIDMPGHVRSALHAYPELMCDPKTLPVACEPGIYEDVLCLGRESAYRFAFTVLEEISELFPFSQVHIGGDEVPKGNWFACPHCLQTIRENRLHSGHELQGHFQNRVICHLESLGKQAVVWNESLLDPALDPDAVCQYWLASGEDLQAVRCSVLGGRSVIDSTFGRYYFDYPTFMTPMKKCYAFESEFAALPNMLGLECALWSEFVPDSATLNSRLFPRLAAFAESAWTSADQKDYTALRESVKSMSGLLRERGVELPPEREWDIPALRGKALTAHFFLTHFALRSLGVMNRIKKQNKVRFD